MKFGIKRLKRLVALTAAALTLTSSVVALDLPAAEAATAGTGNCAVTVDNTSGVVTYEAGIYCYVAFKSTGITYTWTKPVQVTTIDLLVVAGGGGGGARHAGGGGAGGLLQSTNNSLTASTMSITVGAGGAGAGAQSSGVTANGNIGTIHLSLLLALQHNLRMVVVLVDRVPVVELVVAAVVDHVVQQVVVLPRQVKVTSVR